jgi:hypothetical protein
VVDLAERLAAVNARLEQLRRLAEEEQRWCPKCHRIGRRLGDHECREPMTAAEAREIIDAQGGVLGTLPRRVDANRVQSEFDAALDHLTGAVASTGAAIRVGSGAMETLKRSIGEMFYDPAKATVTGPHVVDQYKGIPVLEDECLPSDAFMVLDARVWDRVETFGGDTVDFLRTDGLRETLDYLTPQSPLGILKGIT